MVVTNMSISFDGLRAHDHHTVSAFVHSRTSAIIGEQWIRVRATAQEQYRTGNEDTYLAQCVRTHSRRAESMILTPSRTPQIVRTAVLEMECPNSKFW